MERNYCAFISYRHKPLDMAVAQKLHRMIEGYRIPRSVPGGRKRLGLVFRDKEELPVSGDLNQDICTALDHSENLIVVCSPDAVESRWVQNEIDYFLQRHDRTHVFAVLVKGEPEDVFPERLTHPDPEDPELAVEPLAADVRGKDIPAAVRNTRKESLRLIAGMLGVPYDTLARREQKRTIRRAALACGAVMAVLLGYAGFLLHSNSVIRAKNAELQEKNDTISRQKTILVQNESRLLTDAARSEMNLDMGDMRTALRNVVTALSEEEGTERGYYPPAESVLMEALSVFGYEGKEMYIYTDAIELDAPVYCFTLSGDGRFCYTLDRYGGVFCFDLSSGEQVWQAGVWKTDLRFADVQKLNNDTGIVYCAETAGLLVQGRGITLLDAETGEIRWEYPAAQDFCLTADETRVVTVVGEGWPDVPRIVALDMETGKEISSATAGNGDAPPRLLPVSGGGDGKIPGRTSDEMDNFYFLFDPEDGTVTELWAWPEDMTWPEDVFAWRSAGGQQILFVQPGSDFTSELVCVSEKDRRLLWRKKAPAPAASEEPVEDWSAGGDRPHVLFDGEDGRVYIGNGRTLCVCDMQTGETLFQYADYGEAKLLPASLQALYRIRAGQIGAVLTDGTVMLLMEWNGNLESFASVRLEASDTVAVQGGGFMEIDGDTWNLMPGGGYLLQKTGRNRRELQISRTFEIASPSPGRATEPALESILGDRDDPVPYSVSVEGKAVMLRNGAYNFCSFLRIDTEEGSVAERYFTTDSSGIVNSADPRAEMLADGEHMLLEWRSDADLLLADCSGGTAETLWDAKENGTFYGSVRNGVSCYPAGSSVRIARQADGSVLAAECGWDDVLHVWKDGKEWIAEPLPEEMEWRLLSEESYGLNYYRQLCVGENGLIVLSDYAGSDGTGMSRFAVFDTASRQWRFVADQGRGSAVRQIVFSRLSDRFAVIDADWLIRVYAPEADEPVLTLRLPVPDQAVRQAGITDGGEYYFVLSEDDQLIIYDAQSGETVYREAFTTDDLSSAGNVVLTVDLPNHRLYVAHTPDRGIAPGCCIDIRSWQKLQDIEGLIAFCPETGKILQWLDRGIVLRTIPATEEMLRQARSILENLQEIR